jgi:ammonium transporter Rh
LVQEKADHNLKDRFGCTPLDDAISNNCTDIVALLKQNGAVMGSVSKYEGEFIQAGAEGDMEAAVRLLDNGVDVNCKDYDRRTALHLAVCEGHLELAEYLLSRGADRHCEDRFGTSPVDEASRHSTRTGANHMKLLFHGEEQVAPLIDMFSGSLLVFEIVMIGLFFGVCDYEALALTSDASKLASEEQMRKYPQFMDVHVMIFVGFGFLMTFLRKNLFNSVGLTFLVSAFCIQWHILVQGFLVQLFHAAEGFSKIPISLETLILGDFSAGAVLITYGVLLGKVSPAQLLFLAVFEIVTFSVNEEIGLVMGITDIGGSMVVHMFGAFFGLAASAVLQQKEASDNDNNASVYHSDLFAMIGTLFLWMYWPSFNGALATDAQQMRVTINTVLSLCGSCVFAFAFSYMLRRERRFNMVDVQNATLAGGVAMGSCADLVIGPGASFLIGAISGIVSVVGYVHVQPWLEEKASIHDTCGVNNLHGMPSIIGALAGVIAIGANSEAFAWGIQPGRTMSEQALIQFYFMLITLGISIVTGAIGGLLIKNFSQLPRDTLFIDEKFWEVPSLEMPYYFDHRGEIARGGSGGGGDVSHHGRGAEMEVNSKLTQIENRIAVVESMKKQSNGNGQSWPGANAAPMIYPVWMPPPGQAGPTTPTTNQAAPIQSQSKLEGLLTTILERLDKRDPKQD